MSDLSTSSRRAVAWVVSVAIALAVLPFMLAQVEPGSFTDMARRLDPGWLLAGLTAGILYQVLRAARFARLMALPLSIGLTGTMAAHGVARKLLPAWVSEGAAIWLFRRRHGIAYAGGTATMFLARTIDLLIVAAVLLVAVALGALPMEFPAPAVWGMAALAVVAGGLVFGFARAERWLARSAARQRPLLARLLRVSARLSEAVRSGARQHILLPTVALSLCMWAAIYLRHYAFAVALGFHLAPLDVLWIHLLLIPLQVLPVRGVADLGTHEVGWYVGATVVGLGSAAAAELALGTHLLVFVMTGVYLLIAATIMLLERMTGRGSGNGRGGSAAAYGDGRSVDV